MKARLYFQRMIQHQISQDDCFPIPETTSVEIEIPFDIYPDSAFITPWKVIGIEKIEED